MESNFPSLSELAAKRNDGMMLRANGLIGSTHMQNTTATPTCEPSKNTDGTKKVTAGSDVTNDASTNLVHSGSHNVTNTWLISYFNVASSTSSHNGSAKKTGGK
nr:hypothetical protein [Tanacetum cinerariifolium]